MPLWHHKKMHSEHSSIDTDSILDDMSLPDLPKTRLDPNTLPRSGVLPKSGELGEHGELTPGTEDKSEEDLDRVATSYTIFFGARKTLLMVLLSAIGIWSSISNSIYFPALPVLTEYFGVSPEMMNVSLVVYLIFQGLVPTLTSNLADIYGRRPVVIISFSIYIAACIGISQTRTFWLLAVLRCVQAGGIAPVIAINSGISGDVCTAASRGSFVGTVSGMLLVGQAFGSLLGSLFIARWSWRAVFVFLAIGAGVTLVFVLLLLPETCRSIVGNGSVMPTPLYRAPVLALPGYKRHINNDRSTMAPTLKLDFLSPYKILIEPSVIACLVPSGLQFAAWTMSLTTLARALEGSRYNYSVAHVGLMYLPQGISCLLGSLVSGKALNMYYAFRHLAYEKKYAVEERAHHPFNRLRVRLDVAIIPTILFFFGMVLYGWTLDSGSHVVAVVVGTCMASFGCSASMAIVTTMLVDLHPNRGLASASCINLVRCLLAAAGVAALDEMEAALGIGGCYTLMGGLCLLANLALGYVVVKEGKKERVG